MRRLLRILMSVATVLSLVLCVATMAAWVRSYRARDIVSWWPANQRLCLGINTKRGGFFAGVITPAGATDRLPPPGMRWRYSTPLSAEGSNWFGFALEYYETNEGAARWVACPYWFIILLTAILPGARLAGWRRRARRLRMGPGLCRHCGYDCRATPDRCPECGRGVAG